MLIEHPKVYALSQTTLLVGMYSPRLLYCRRGLAETHMRISYKNLFNLTRYNMLSQPLLRLTEIIVYKIDPQNLSLT